MSERDIAREWYERVVWIQYGHYRTALSLTRRHQILGGLNVGLSAVVGTSLFATLGNQANLLVFTGVVSILTTLVAAIQAFLSYGERADKHRIAGARYGVVGRRLEVLLARPELNVNELEKVEERLGALSQECPHIPEYVNKQMQKEPPKGVKFED